jgi:hypothetical protein
MNRALPSLACLTLMTAACSPKQPPPRQAPPNVDAPNEPSAPSAPPPLPQAVTAAVAPAAKPEGARTDVARTLLRYDGQGQLTPLACWNPLSQGLSGGPDCLPFLAAGTAVWLAGGRQSQIDRHVRVECEPSGDSSEGVQLVAGAVNDTDPWPEFGAVPVDLGAWLWVAPAQDTAARPDGPTWSAVVRASKQPAEKLTLEQSLALDVDRDGREELLVSVVAKGSEPDTGEFAFSGLFLVRAGRPPVLLEESTMHRYRVLATLDLDGDGKRELLLQSTYYEGDETSLVRVIGDKVEVIAARGCGA